jgi:hypothetical protein
MYSLWFLPAVLLAVPFLAVWRNTRSRRRELDKRIQSIIQPSAPNEIVPEPVWLQTRMTKWISINEFMTVLTTCSDLIVIDLRADARLVPFPVPTAIVLPIAPDELFNVLECLPTDRTVVLCGASNISVFMIETIPCKEGSAPLYVLEGGLHFAEVA